MLTEDQRVAHEIPKDGHETRDAKALCEHAQHVLGANQTAVEKRETRQRHEKDERGANHQKPIVTRSGQSSELPIRRGRQIVEILLQITHSGSEFLGSRWSGRRRSCRSGCGRRRRCRIRGLSEGGRSYERACDHPGQGNVFQRGGGSHHLLGLILLGAVPDESCQRQRVSSSGPLV